MPNEQGEYGGGGKQPPRSGRRVNRSAAGGADKRPAVPGGQETGQTPRPETPAPQPDEVTRRTQEFRDTYGFDPPKEFTSSWQAAHSNAARERAEAAEGRQDVPPRPGVQQPGEAVRRPVMSEAQARAGARRAREQRRARQRLAILGTGACILVLAGVITLLLPKGEDKQNVNAATAEQAQGLEQSAVAPLPYANGEGGDGSEAVQVDWGDVGPAHQTESFTYTAAPAAPGPEVPAFGQVDLSWFSDAAFLGDSLTAGLAFYSTNVGGGLICGYEGTSPNEIVHRTTLTDEVRGEEIPLEVLGEKQPAKLYVLLGTNALVGTGNDDGFMSYYSQMLDALRETLPNATIFVQSILSVRPEALESAPGLAPDRLAGINDKIKQLCAEKGCLFINLTAGLCGEDGYLREDLANTDGIHMVPDGYSQWIGFLAEHVPYNKNNVYQTGSAYYLTDAMKQLIADLP